MSLKKTQNKTQFFFFCLSVFIVAGGFFFWDALAVYAEELPQAPEDSNGYFALVFKGLLYGIWYMTALLLNAAVILFQFVIQPAHFSKLFNLISVYEMWKFIRDFFNLFFILVLLYTAFTIVFQVAKDYKKALLSIVLAALFINFSFPISRFIIDATNVPMYFFVDQITALERGGGLSSFFSASKLGGILLTDGVKSPFVNHFLAIIFTFLLAISFAVLAVMMFVRLVGLLILVIFSSVGFAASIIPGMGKFSDQWWEKFLQYALFGPAAALMILISVRFLQGVAGETYFKQLATQSATNGNLSKLLESMVTFSIPIILLWFTIGIANHFSIAGASTVSNLGYGAANWARKKTWGGTKWVGLHNPITRGIGQGLKEQVSTRFPGKQILAPSKLEAGARGVFGRGTRRGELESLDQKAAYEEAKKMKERNAGNSELKDALHGNDKKQAAAAAIVLSERKAIDTADDFAAALTVLGKNTKEVSSLIANADSGALKFDDEKKDTDGKTQLDRVMEAPAYSVNSKLRGDLESRMKKEGQAKMAIEYKIKTETKKGRGLGEVRTEVYAETLDKYSADDLAKQGSLFEKMDENPELTKYVQDRVNLSAKGFQDAYSKANAKVQENWIKAGINLQGSQTPQAASKEKEGMDKRRQKLKETREKNGR